MSCQRRMTCCVLFPSLLRRARQIPAVPHHCVSTSLSLSAMIHCSWISCRISSESWRRRTWLCGPRYIRLQLVLCELGVKQIRVFKIQHQGFSWSTWLFCVTVCQSLLSTFPPCPHPSVSFIPHCLQSSLAVCSQCSCDT